MTRALLAVVVLVGLWLGPLHVAGAARLPLPAWEVALAVDEAGGSVTQRGVAEKAGEIPGEGLPASSTGSTPYVIDLAPHETVRVLTVAQSRALAASGGPVMTLARIGWCEGKLDPASWSMDVDGTPSVGAWQVKPQFHGVVPSDLAGQAAQAARIIEALGTRPWAAQSCAEWSVR